MFASRTEVPMRIGLKTKGNLFPHGCGKLWPSICTYNERRALLEANGESLLCRLRAIVSAEFLARFRHKDYACETRLRTIGRRKVQKIE